MGLGNLDRQRQLAVRNVKGADGQPILNGIDYLEVASDRRTLNVYFLHPLPSLLSSANNTIPLNASPLNETNLLIQGGTRIQTIQVEFASALDKLLTVRVNKVGDRSVYTLRLVKSANQLEPPDGFDPQLSSIEFVFQIDEISEFDCQLDAIAKTELELPIPAIDYLAKDYTSFRELMMNRLAVTMPNWTERNPADVGVMLVELMAYAADYLSYYQDAIATEAYLETARQRVSVRRHARLLDYFLHNGRNARSWVSVQILPEIDGMTLMAPSEVENRPGTKFVTRIQADCGLTQQEFENAIRNGAPVFEAMHEITLYAAQNEIEIYAWGTEEFWLAAGTTQTTLKDTGGRLRQQLRPGHVLIFEQVRGSSTGNREDADPTRRHVVRLVRVSEKEDRLAEEGSVESADRVVTAQRLVEIEWALEDALPFSLCVATRINDQIVKNISVVRGNIILVDHGYTVEEVLEVVPETRSYRPRLSFSPLTQQSHVHSSDHLLRSLELDPTISATKTIKDLDLRDLRPSIWLQELNQSGQRWRSQPDLLISDRFARDFVVEVEDDGRAYLRFGDNQLGRKPAPNIQFQAIYRIGNGTAGNVGAEAIAHIFPAVQGIVSVRNLLPAEGGIDPEPLDQVRRQAPQAFRDRQCAVTEADYAELAETYPGVKRALATRRWTGSWSTIFIAVDLQDGQLIDEDFRRNLLAFLNPFRLSGHTLELENSRFVPLDIAMTVQVKSDYFRSDVRSLLLQAFSHERQPNQQPGFFHPDRLTFAQSIYLSEVVKTAMQIAGVETVKVTRFQRLWQPPQGELEIGELTFERLEIPVLRNDPNAPEDGRIAFDLQGGLAYA